MLLKLLGIFWILMGLLSLIHPAFLRARLGKKTNRKVSWPFYTLLFFLAMNLIGFMMKVQGFWYRLVGFLTVFIVIRALLTMKSKLMNRFLEWWGCLPLYVFRILAMFFLVIGVALLKSN